MKPVEHEEGKTEMAAKQHQHKTKTTKTTQAALITYMRNKKRSKFAQTVRA
jgi:hypothetical protein